MSIKPANARCGEEHARRRPFEGDSDWGRERERGGAGRYMLDTGVGFAKSTGVATEMKEAGAGLA